ncbi:MAG: AbrB/MazE/SpoVT family DNA-binding domain-containing protein [Terracidiphilus sp.]
MSATNTTPKAQTEAPAPSATATRTETRTETRTAKLFKNGRSQAVRLPKEYRFEGTEVAIRRDPATGEVILAPAPPKPSISFDEWFALYDAIPDDAPEEEFAKLPPRPAELTTEQLFKVIRRTHFPGDLMAHRRALVPQSSWEERFAVWDALGSPDEDALERDQTPPVERDFF